MPDALQAFAPAPSEGQREMLLPPKRNRRKCPHRDGRPADADGRDLATRYAINSYRFLARSVLRLLPNPLRALRAK